MPMKCASCLALLLLFLCALLPAQSKKKATVSAVFNNARYVWVEAMDGDAFTRNLLPEDRDAIFNVEGALRDWKRYALTVRRNEAELVFIVRKGRAASVHVVGTVDTSTYPGSRPQGTSSRGSGVGVGGEVGPPDDLLEVHQVMSDGSVGVLLWQASLHNGLNAPQVALVSDLRKAVDKDYPLSPPPAKP